MEILIATHNPGKLAEYRRFFSGLDIVFLDLGQVGIVDEAPEDEESLHEISLSKARFYGDRAHMLTMADDAGLFVDALNGAPGIRSNSLGNTEQERIEELLRRMINIPEGQRTASFRGVFTLYNPKTSTHISFEGRSDGVILNEPVLGGGFGYDPVFYSVENNKAYSELSPTKKSEISYRGKGFQQLKKYLQEKYSI